MFKRRLFFTPFILLLLGACGQPRSLPTGPTPIPTLIPVTEPSSGLEATAAPSFAIQRYPARSPSAALGNPLYEAHCANCHGGDGNGVVPGARNFGDLDYMRGESPAYFYTAITEGRGDMPPFKDELSSDERWDVMFYIWRFSTNAENLALGEQLYESDCAVCHGTDGSSEVLGAANFTDLRLMGERAMRDFYLTITQGKGSMPAWQGRLTQDERWAVIDYMLTFIYDSFLPGDTSAVPQPTPEVVETTCDPAILEQSNPYAWDDSTAIDSGMLTYNQYCASCHGADGSGQLPNTSDFTSNEVSADLRATSGEYFCIVAEGQQVMPGWKETLTTDEIWQVLTYMASFGSD